jgi:hypothetical protein
MIAIAAIAAAGCAFAFEALVRGPVARLAEAAMRLSDAKSGSAGADELGVLWARALSLASQPEQQGSRSQEGDRVAA